MTQQIKFDALRYCRNNAGRMGRWQGQDVAGLIADEIHRLRMADDLAQQGAEHMREEMAEVKAELAALKEAVAWEKECIRQLDYAGKFWEDDNIPGRELIMILDAARAEVDRMMEDEK